MSEMAPVDAVGETGQSSFSVHAPRDFAVSPPSPTTSGSGPREQGAEGARPRLRAAAATGPGRGSQPTGAWGGVRGWCEGLAGDRGRDGPAVVIVPSSDSEQKHHGRKQQQQQQQQTEVLQKERPSAYRLGDSTPKGEHTPEHDGGRTQLSVPEGRLLGRQSSGGSSSGDSGCCGCAAALRDLHRENHGLRTRVRGVEVLDKALQRTRTELAAERQKGSKLEKAVANLQSRLHRAGLDASIDLAEEEIFIPGPDRTFVNQLILENGRLQKQLKAHTNSSEAADRISELEKTLQERTQQEQDQRDEVRRKDAEVSQLQVLLQSSDDAKLAKITHLEDEGTRLTKELRDLETAIAALTDEAGRSRRELDEAKAKLSEASSEIAVWQEKASGLEDRLAAHLAQKKMEEEAKKKEGALSVSDRLQLAQGQVDQLTQENSRLTEQLKEVVGMNTRWQRYNQQREAQLTRLTKADSAQRSTVTVLERRCSELQQALNDLNALLQAQRDEQRRGADAAVLSLEQQLVQREDRISELAEELGQLKMYLRSSEEERKGGSGGQRQEDKTMIETLQQQVKIYQDDFNQERKDRERIKGNLEIMKHRLKEANRQLEHMKYLEMTRPKSPRDYKPRERLVARGLPEPVYSEAFDFVPDDDDDLEVDGVASDEVDATRTEPLQCPSCAERFMVTEHTLFMQHIQVCLDQ